MMTTGTNPASTQDLFMQLYEPAHARLSRYVQTIVWDQESAKDIIGETILKAYENFGDLRKPESFHYFLFTIARRLIYKMERKKKWWGLYTKDVYDNIPDVTDSTYFRIEMNELKLALANLPAKQREAIVLFEISGFSLAEIQQMQGGTLSGVKSRVARARDELRKQLEIEGKTGNQSNYSRNTGENVLI